MKINRFSIALAIMVCSLVSACSRGGTHSFTPSPDGSVIASIREVEVFIPAPDNPPVISDKSYLRIQKIPLSTEPSLTEMLITDERGEHFFLHHGGLTWSPNGRSVAFTTGNVAIDYAKRRPCRLWIVGISAKPKKALIAENVHSFRWADGAHLVYVTEAGEVYRATISDDGAVLELKTLFSAGNLDGAYDYAYLLPQYEFNNPLSPHADYFVYGNGRNLTIVNLSTATIEKSFPLIGVPIKFWWDDAGRDCVIGVMKKTGDYKCTYHYYLYQREGGTLANLVNQLEDTSRAVSPYAPSGYGRVWCSDGKHFVLNSGYPYYKTWLFNTASWSAVWMEREIKRIKDETSSQLTMVPLPLEHREYDSSRDSLPELPRVVDANSASKVVIEPSPRGNLLAVRPHKSEQLFTKYMCYVLEIAINSKGEMSFAARKKIEFEGRERFFWTADGGGLLFSRPKLFVAGDKFRLESIP